MSHPILYPTQADVDRVTYKLFSPFRREVGIPRRSTIYNWSQFKSFVDKNNGINDCYAAVYPFDNHVSEITQLDRIMFDFDASLVEIDKALESAKVMYDLLVSYGLNVIPIATGSKGLQLHVLFKPESFSNAKETLWLTSYTLMKEAYKGNSKLMSALDVHPVGDVRRICRIPNTSRPPTNRFFSSFLPQALDTVTPEDVIEHMVNPKAYDYDFTRKLSFNDIDLTESYQELIPYGNSSNPVFIPKQSLSATAQELTVDMLGLIIRPCLFRNLQLGEPPHSARVATTIDLINLGFRPPAIAKIYSKLGWVDYDINKTLYQISTIYDPKTEKSRLIPYGCSKLRRLRIPKICCVG